MYAVIHLLNAAALFLNIYALLWLKYVMGIGCNCGKNVMAQILLALNKCQVIIKPIMTKFTNGSWCITAQYTKPWLVHSIVWYLFGAMISFINFII